MSLANLLARVPGVYADLVDAALPGRSGEPPVRSPDPWEKPAPGNLSVMEHRHKLLRGLRWWVDAVHDGEERLPSGDSVPAMARWLTARLGVLADEDSGELRANLQDWLHDAYPFMGDTRPTEQRKLPLEALEAELAPVRVADAAALLGCTVRTIQRRVPAERRPGGLVLLREAWRCDHCQLPWGECEHTRNVTPLAAQ